MKSDSSTSSSEETGFEPGYFADLLRFGRKLFTILAAFAVFEVASYMFTPTAHPLQAPSDEKQRVYEKMLFDDSHYDVFMIGSSMANSAFDPDTFDPIFGKRSFNAGIANRSNTTWQLEMMREIIEHKKPKLIIYAIESFSLRAHAHVPSTQMYRFLTLYQNRETIGKWFNQTLHGNFAKPPAFLPPDDTIWQRDKRFQSFRTQTVHPNGFLDVDAVGNPDFEPVGGRGPFLARAEQSSAFETMMTTARAAGVELIFLQLPEYAGEVQKGHERHEAFRAYMLKNAVAKGFLYLDFNLELEFPRDQIELYYDTIHLNGTGARLFSANLAKILKDR